MLQRYRNKSEDDRAASRAESGNLRGEPPNPHGFSQGCALHNLLHALLCVTLFEEDNLGNQQVGFLQLFVHCFGRFRRTSHWNDFELH